MPTFPDHYRLQFGGGLRGDIWSCNINFVKIAGAPTTDTRQEALCALFENQIKTWFATAGSAWSSASTLDYVKYNRIGPSGAYFNTGVTHVKFVSPVQGGGSTPVLSNSDALVVSWKTVVARGLASRGRIYIPAPAAPPNATTGRITNTLSLSVANTAAVFINSANAVATDGGEPVEACVVSGVAPGTFHKITGVRVGDVIDTQQRRRNNLVETYYNNVTAIA